MDGYGYNYPGQYPPMRPPEGEYPDHGDGFGEYYGLGPLNEERGGSFRRSRSKSRARRYKEAKRTRSRSKSLTKLRSRSRSLSRSRSKSQSRSQSRSRSVSRARTRSRSRSRSRSGTRRELHYKETGFLDAFRVLYLTPSNCKKNASKYLATKKRQDRIQELLKSDGLGSKRWFFYPRQKTISEPPLMEEGEVAGCRENCDQRVKVDGDFFRKYKRSKKIDHDAPIAKLKRWELILYKKLGFIQAV